MIKGILVYKYLIMSIAVVFSVLEGNAAADNSISEVKGVDGGLIHFKKWDDLHGGWSSVQYDNREISFIIYNLPLTATDASQGTVATTDERWLSPDKKLVLLERTNFSSGSDPSGHEANLEHTTCDVVSLETGCLEYVGAAEECDGAWSGNEWKARDGATFDTSGRLLAPNILSKKIKGVADIGSRTKMLMDFFNGGVGSYMACYPPVKNISAYNDLGYYFSLGGQDQIAIEIYRRLLVVAPDRVPLKLNMADSLWGVKRFDEAKEFYKSYLDIMSKQGSVTRVPERVTERLVLQKEK
jgi:hypothetical protein